MTGSRTRLCCSLMFASAMVAAAPTSVAFAAASGADRGGVPFGAVAIGLVVMAALLFGLWAWFYYKSDDPRLAALAQPPEPPPPPPPPEPSITLAGFDADGRSVRCEISRNQARRGVVIGRAERGARKGHSREHIAVSQDQRVSREHIRIDHDGDAFRVTDLGSLNKTFLNDSKVPPDTPRRLSQNDKLTLGPLVLHVAFNGNDGVSR